MTGRCVDSASILILWFRVNGDPAPTIRLVSGQTGVGGVSYTVGGAHELADPLDTELPTWFTSDHARHAHRRYWQQLKDSPAPW